MAVQKEIWQRTIVEGLFADNTFMAKAVNDDMYVNEGKKVHIPNAGASSGWQKNRTSVPASASKRIDTDVDYELDELTTNPVYIPYADTVELSYNKRNSVIDQDRRSLIENAANLLLEKWCPAAANRVLTTGLRPLRGLLPRPAAARSSPRMTCLPSRLVSTPITCLRPAAISCSTHGCTSSC